jgi:hypothetical protein
MRMPRSLKIMVFAVALAFQPSSGWAQKAAEVTGIITDNSGAVVPGVEVLITHEQTGVQKKVLTNEAGVYRVLELNPGPHKIEAQLKGFKTSVVRSVLDSSRVATVDLTLEVGELSEQVSVQASGIALETQSQTVSTFIERQVIEDLPMIYRRPGQLISLAPGVTNSFTVRDNPNIPFYGALGVPCCSGAQFYLDGGYLSSGRAGSQVMDYGPGVEEVQEFRVVTSTHKAETAGGGAGLIQMTTRSGTNEFHG